MQWTIRQRHTANQFAASTSETASVAPGKSRNCSARGSWLSSQHCQQGAPPLYRVRTEDIPQPPPKVVMHCSCLIYVFVPRVNDTSSKFHGCLASSAGKELRFDPNNDPVPPNGCGVQLCFKALPHYNSQTNGEKKNLPILVKDEHELSRLYLQEFYNKEQDCSISQLDPGAIFRILKGASCFSAQIKAQAEVVREVRNQWAHAMMDKWDDKLFQDSFVKIEALANLLPNNLYMKRKLQDDKKGDSSFLLLEQLKTDAMKDIQHTAYSIQNEILQNIKDAGFNIEADLLATHEAKLEEIKAKLEEIKVTEANKQSDKMLQEQGSNEPEGKR